MLLRERHALLLLVGSGGVGLSGLVVVGLAAGSMLARDMTPQSKTAVPGSVAMEEDMMGGVRPPSPVVSEPGPAPPVKRRPKPKSARSKGGSSKRLRKGGAPKADAAKGGLADDDEAADRGEVGLRQWFPESFLWRPHLQTDETGTATVSLRVPDQLTSWRVLALAHSAEGEQAGALHSFSSSLPTYVDPVVPGWLYAGDRLWLPVQVVHNGARPLNSSLRVEVSGAMQGGGSAAVRLGPGDSDLYSLPLRVQGAGRAVVEARLVGFDAARREIPIMPGGRRVVRSRGGTLSGPRSLRFKAPRRADLRTQLLQVQVFPGPLSVLQAELERTLDQPGAAVAYGLGLGRQLEALLLATGAPRDAPQLRRLRLLAWQRMIVSARNPTPGHAADLLTAMGPAGPDDLPSQLRRRLQRTLQQGQRADGSWARQDSASLQTVVVQTAYAARALPPDARGAWLRAGGAIERYAREIDDAYTASVVLASGLAQGALRERLLSVVIDGTREGAYGAHELGVLAPEVRNIWGQPPSTAERAAWAALALADQDLPWKGDLISLLLSGYHASRGFGAGAADPVALQAIARAMPPLPGPVEVVLSQGGRELARTTVDPSQPKLPLPLEALPAGDLSPFTLAVEPPTPGLAWVGSLQSWVPWSAADQLDGVEVVVSARGLRVGQEGSLTLRISAPSGVAVSIRQGLPAGAVVGPLDGLDGVVSSRVHSDGFELQTTRFGAGELRTLIVPVRPAFAGRFSTAPLQISAAGQQAELAPLVWVVGQ